METLKRNMVPGRGEVLGLEHLLWVGLLECLLVRRILEHVEAGRLVGSIKLGSRVPGGTVKTREHLLHCCQILRSTEAAKELG